MVVPSRSSLQDTVPRQESVQPQQPQQHLSHLLLLRPHHHNHHQYQHNNNISSHNNLNPPQSQPSRRSGHSTTKPYRDGKTKLIPPPRHNNNRCRRNKHSQHDPYDQLEEHDPFDQSSQPPLDPFDPPNQHHQRDCDPHRRRPSRPQRPLISSKTAADTREDRSWKKARWESNRPTSKRPLRSRDFPDPLTTISCPDLSAPARSRTTSAPSVFIHPAHPALPVRRITRQSHHLPVAIDADAQQHAGPALLGSPGSPRRSSVGDTDTISRPSLPNGAALVPERRLLRSHDGGSRSKSELAMYFPNYEQMISLELPKSGKKSLPLSHCADTATLF
jgi:hypothetical protein